MHEFADGGITSSMVMGPGKALYKWREPETGGEAFFPRFGNQARNDANMRKVAEDWYGGKYLSADEVSNLSPAPGPDAAPMPRRRRLSSAKAAELHLHAHNTSAKAQIDELLWAGR